MGIGLRRRRLGFLQGLEYISSTFDWPRQIQQLTTLALLIGLPIVLVLAWYHGDRGQQRISTPEFAILTLLLLLGGGTFWYYQRASDAGNKDAATTTDLARREVSPEIKDARPSIAVLPFENRSRLEDDAFFVDGIHDDILTQVSKVSALRVISRTSVEQFRDTKLPMKTIAGQLGVTKILEGGVQRAGDRVRINVQLIDADTDAHLWADSYDRELTAANIFAIQSEVASAIAGALKAALTPAEAARVAAVATSNLEAWETYQRGMQHMAKRSTAALAEAEVLFRRAIDLDTRFTLAYIGLADTLTLQTEHSGHGRKAKLAEAERLVTNALEFDGNLAEAWAAAGLIASSRMQLERSEQMFRRAIALNPNYAPAHHWLSYTLMELGRRDEALAAAERAVLLDPLSVIINNNLGLARMNVGRFSDAQAAFGRAIEIDSNLAAAYADVGNVSAYGLGRLDTAVPWFEKAASLDPGSPEVLSRPILAHWELGSDVGAAQRLSQLLALGEGTAFSNLVASLVYLERRDDASARRHARLAADLDPWTLFLIRNHDLRKGDYATARERYAKAFPELFDKAPMMNERSAFAAIDLALLLQHTGQDDQANELLNRSEVFMRKIPRKGLWGFGISDVAIFALRGDSVMALTKLREAERAGWRGPFWRYYRDFDPNLASIRSEPEFKAVFADIERDMTQQRARLAARPKDAPLPPP